MTEAERATLYFTQELLVTLVRGFAGTPGLQPQAFKDMANLVEQSVSERYPELKSQFVQHAKAVCDGIDQDTAPNIRRRS